jgi:hypothetical protein
LGDHGYDADTVSFFSADYNPATDELACDIEKVEIGMSVREQTGEGVIIRKITENLLSPRVLDPEEEVLCGSVRSLNFRYYDGTDWLDEWDSSGNDNSLPKAVEITIVLEDADKAGDKDSDDYEDNLYEYKETVIIPCA